MSNTPNKSSVISPGDNHWVSKIKVIGVLYKSNLHGLLQIKPSWNGILANWRKGIRLN